MLPVMSPFPPHDWYVENHDGTKEIITNEEYTKNWRSKFWAGFETRYDEVKDE